MPYRYGPGSIAVVRNGESFIYGRRTSHGTGIDERQWRLCIEAIAFAILNPPPFSNRDRYVLVLVFACEPFFFWN